MWCSSGKLLYIYKNVKITSGLLIFFKFFPVVIWIYFFKIVWVTVKRIKILSWAKASIFLSLHSFLHFEDAFSDSIPATLRVPVIKRVLCIVACWPSMRKVNPIPLITSSNLPSCVTLYAVLGYINCFELPFKHSSQQHIVTLISQFRRSDTLGFVKFVKHSNCQIWLP